MATPLESGLRIASLESAFLVTGTVFLFVLPIPHTTTIRLTCLFSAAIMAAVLVRRHGLPPMPLVAPFVVWLIVALASLFTAVDVRTSLNEIKTEILYSFLAYAVFYTQTRSRSEWNTWLATIAAILALLSVTNVYLWYTSGDASSPRFVYNGVGAYTTFLITVLPFVVLFTFNASLRGAARWFARAAPLLLIAPAFFSLNRTVWIVTAVLLLTVLGLLMLGNKIQKSRLAVATGVLALCAICVHLLFASLERRVAVQGGPEQIVGQTLSTDPRRELWAFSVTEIASRPWHGLGFGMESFAAAYPEWKARSTLHAHNMFLDAGLQMGLAGVLLLALLFGAVVREYWRLYRSDNSIAQWIGACGIAMVIAVVTRNMTDDFFRRDLALLFWSLVGASLGYGRRIMNASEGRHRA